MEEVVYGGSSVWKKKCVEEVVYGGSSVWRN